MHGIIRLTVIRYSLLTFSVFLIVILSLSECLFSLSLTHPIKGGPSEKPPLELKIDVIGAFDSRLPKITDLEMKQVLDEASRILNRKFESAMNLSFQDHGQITLQQFFGDLSYRKTSDYQTLVQRKYDVVLGEKTPFLQDSLFKKQYIQSLKNWKIEVLKDFFPGKKITDHEEFFTLLMDTLHKKVEWLKTIRMDSGDPLLILPPVPWQSSIEWCAKMFSQKDYDLVITNTLIVADNLHGAYPHSICKHAKIGGEVYGSRRKGAFDGSSIMVNVLENLCGIKEIRRDSPEASRPKSLKVIGAFLMAHEIAHSVFLIPDVYDHGDSCLMNSSLNNMDNVKGYDLLTSDLSPCNKCAPWVKARMHFYAAKKAVNSRQYSLATYCMLDCIRQTPKIIAGNYKQYIQALFSMLDQLRAVSGVMSESEVIRLKQETGIE